MPYSAKHKANTRMKIVEVARILFNRRGFNGVTIDEIMAEAGLTRGGFYSHFATKDALYDEAVRFVCESRRASISAVQRKLKIGYNRAARMIEAMEMAGVVTPMNTNGSREVIAPPPVRD